MRAPVGVQNLPNLEVLAPKHYISVLCSTLPFPKNYLAHEPNKICNII